MFSGQKVSSSSGAIRSRLEHEDQADLRWFFVEGAVAFDRSPMGPMLDSAELFTFGPMVCPSCDGEGFCGDIETALRDAIDRARKWEAACGTRLADALREWRKENDEQKPPWYDDGQCAACGGSGWIPRRRKLDEGSVQPTARPTGSSVNKRGGIEPSSDLLERYGFVCTRLLKLSKRHHATFEAFFGLPGTRWSDDRGRIWGLMPLTFAGQKIVKSSKKRGLERGLRDDEILNVEAELQKVKPMKTRRALFAAAREQAEERLRKAELAWNMGGDNPLESADRVLAKIRNRLARMKAREEFELKPWEIPSGPQEQTVQEVG
jgi:hypothetical protein